jgi:hypothetical protein
VLCSVTFLIQDQGEEDLASLVSAKLIDKITTSLNDLIDKLSDSVASAKTFLLATSQQQATELLSLQESVKHQSVLTKSLVESAEKLSLTPPLHVPSNSAWPPLPTTSATTPLSIHPASLLHLHTHNPSPTASKLLHRVSLASKQLLIEYGPLDENEAPREKSIEAQRELRQLFNSWLDNPMSTPEGTVISPPSRAIRNVSIFDRPAILLEFNSTTSKDAFTSICVKNTSLLTKINPKARIRPRTYAVILRFVLCQGQFNPSIDDHLRTIKRENDLAEGSISAASWCK